MIGTKKGRLSNKTICFQEKLICDWPANTKCNNKINAVTRPLAPATSKPPKRPIINPIPGIDIERPTLDVKPELLDGNNLKLNYK